MPFKKLLLRSLVFLAFTYPFAHANALQVPGPLVDTEWVAKNLDNIVVLDVRADEESFKEKAKAGGGFAGIQACGAGGGEAAEPISGHIAGAVFVDWKHVRADRKLGEFKLKGLLPTRSTFERMMRKAGISNDSAVVITGVGKSPTDVLMTTRLYWTLKYFGHNNMAILDGGMAQWVQDKRDVEYGKGGRGSGKFKASEPHNEILATTEDIQADAKGNGRQLLDVRNPDVYLGLTYNRKLVQPQAKGHIPHAKNAPVSLFVDAMAPAVKFYPVATVKSVAKLIDVDTSAPTDVYCETGAQASLVWFVLHELIGNSDARVYDGSMNEWSTDSSRPVVDMEVQPIGCGSAKAAQGSLGSVARMED